MVKLIFLSKVGSLVSQGIGANSSTLHNLLSLSKEEILRRQKEDAAKVTPEVRERYRQRALRYKDPRLRLYQRLKDGTEDPLKLKPSTTDSSLWDNADAFIVREKALHRMREKRKQLTEDSYLDNAALDQKYNKMFKEAQGMIPFEFFQRLRVEEEKKAYKARLKLENYGRFDKVFQEAEEQTIVEKYIDEKISEEELAKVKTDINKLAEKVNKGTEMTTREVLEMYPKLAQELQDRFDRDDWYNVEEYERALAKDTSEWDLDTAKHPEQYWFLPGYEDVEVFLKGGKDPFVLTDEELEQIEAKEKRAALKKQQAAAIKQ